MQHSPELDSALVALLDHARNMFRAELAEVILYPRAAGDDALPDGRSNRRAARSWSRSRHEHRPRPSARRSAEKRAFFQDPGWRSGGDAGSAVDGEPADGRVRLIGAIIVSNRLDRGDELRRRTISGCSRPSQTRRPSPSRTASWSSRWPSCRGSRSSSATRPIHDPLTGLREPDDVRRTGRAAAAGRAERRSRSSCSSTSTTSRSSTTRSAMPPATSCWRRRRADRSCSGRTTLPPASAATSSPSSSSTARLARRWPSPTGSSTRSSSRSGSRAGHGRRRQHRGRARRAGDEGRRAAAQRRRRDVHGQGRRQEPRRSLRPDDACRHRGPPRPVRGPARSIAAAS